MESNKPSSSSEKCSSDKDEFDKSKQSTEANKSNLSKEYENYDDDSLTDSASEGEGCNSPKEDKFNLDYNSPKRLKIDSNTINDDGSLSAVFVKPNFLPKKYKKMTKNQITPLNLDQSISSSTPLNIILNQSTSQLTNELNNELNNELFYNQEMINEKTIENNLNDFNLYTYLPFDSQFNNTAINLESLALIYPGLTKSELIEEYNKQRLIELNIENQNKLNKQLKESNQFDNQLCYDLNGNLRCNLNNEKIFKINWLFIESLISTLQLYNKLLFDNVLVAKLNACSKSELLKENRKLVNRLDNLKQINSCCEPNYNLKESNRKRLIDNLASNLFFIMKDINTLDKQIINGQINSNLELILILKNLIESRSTEMTVHDKVDYNCDNLKDIDQFKNEVKNDIKKSFNRASNQLNKKFSLLQAPATPDLHTVVIVTDLRRLINLNRPNFVHFDRVNNIPFSVSVKIYHSDKNNCKMNVYLSCHYIPPIDIQWSLNVKAKFSVQQHDKNNGPIKEKKDFLFKKRSYNEDNTLFEFDNPIDLPTVFINHPYILNDSIIIKFYFVVYNLMNVIN